MAISAWIDALTTLHPTLQMATAISAILFFRLALSPRKRRPRNRSQRRRASQPPVGPYLAQGRAHSGDRWQIGASFRLLQELAQAPSPARRFWLLRRCDHFVFEEAVLSAFEAQGFTIQRTARYTGDGGFDGQVWIDGRRHLIQSKRYSRHISKAHLRAFDRLCEEKGCEGLFVHTGRTGRGARASETARVTIISGQRLLDLLAGHPYQHRASRLPEQRQAASA